MRTRAWFVLLLVASLGSCGRTGMNGTRWAGASADAMPVPGPDVATDAGPVSGRDVATAAPEVEPSAPDTRLVPMPELTLSPNPLDFGTLPVFAAGRPQTLTVTAHSQVMIVAEGSSGTGLATGADHCLMKSMNAGDTCTLQVIFTMAAAGAFSGEISVETGTLSSYGPYYKVPVTALGVLADAGTVPDGPGARADTTDAATRNLRDAEVEILAAANIVADPSSATRAAAPGGSSSPLVINVTNRGGVATGELFVTLSGAGIADFVISVDTCSGLALAPSEMCGLMVTYVPALTANDSEIVTLIVTDGKPGASRALTMLTGILQ